MECRRGLAIRILSVRSSVCHMRELRQNGKKICQDLYTLRKIIYPSFLRRRMVDGGDPFYLKFSVNRPPFRRIADFQPIFTRISSAVTTSKKVQLTVIGSPLRAFQ